MRRFLVMLHQARIAGDVGHQYRGEPSFDTIAGNLKHLVSEKVIASISSFCRCPSGLVKKQVNVPS